MRLRLAPGKLHFWDPKTRLNLWAFSRPEGTVPDDADLSNISIALATGVLVRVDDPIPPAGTEIRKEAAPPEPPKPAEEPIQEQETESQVNEEASGEPAEESVALQEPEPAQEAEPQEGHEVGTAAEEAAKPAKPKHERKRGRRSKKS